MKRVVLEAVTSGLVRSKEDMKRYVTSTLMATLQKESYETVLQVTRDAITDLQKEKFIFWTPEGLWAAHPLGKGSSASGLSPCHAHLLHADLKRVRAGVLLLHSAPPSAPPRLCHLTP